MIAPYQRFTTAVLQLVQPYSSTDEAPFADVWRFLKSHLPPIKKALDSEAEAEIQMALNQVMENKTVIAIAHRLSTIARMDRIIVLDEGKIVEEGTHEPLLQAKRLYANFWSRQSGGFIGVEKPQQS